MRPAKVVLCVGADEVKMSVRVFLLRTRGYKPLAASSAEEALAILSSRLPGTVDLLLADLPVAGLSAKVFRQARRLHPQLHTLVTCDHAESYDAHGADVVLLRRGCDSPAELLERVRCLVMRKRGPHTAEVREQLSGISESRKREADPLRDDKQRKPAAGCALPATSKSVARNRKVA